MPRSSKSVKKRIIISDTVYKSRLVTRFANLLMKGGKKVTAQKILYKTLANISKDNKEALALFEQAVKNVMPKQEVRSRRVGGATYQIPVPLKHDRSEALAMRWLIQASRSKKGSPMDKKLLEEVKLASKNEGSAIKKRDDVHRMAEANKAFAHFRF